MSGTWEGAQAPEVFVVAASASALQHIQDLQVVLETGCA